MAKKTLYFDSYCGYSFSVITENGKVTEFNFEKSERASIIGNIYKGRVETVLQGMRAAFVNCGLERNCYLSADDIFPDAGKYDGENGQTEMPELKEGDELIVQVVKPPVGKKGAKVTAHPSFVGNFLIYMPLTPFVGVSRKIADEELRKNLIYSAGRLKSQNEGLIFRTAAPYAKRNKLELELGYLRNMYTGIGKAFESAKVGDLLYTDLELCMRVMRDTLIYDVEKIYVGSPKLKDTVSRLIELYPPAHRRPVLLHDSPRDMLEENGLSSQIDEITSPRVNLDNGGYLIIESTEALTVIDVNTGKFTGEYNLEQTVYYTNVLAAREIARQVKLRNIGGIVVVDFIDMTAAAHNKSIAQELERALKKDGSKCSVAPMSEFGLVEFTRKRTASDSLSLMTVPCRNCRGGKIKSPRYILMELRARLMSLYADGARKLRADMSAALHAELEGWKELKEELKKLLPEAELYSVPHRSFHDEQLYCNTGEIPHNAVKIL